MHAVDVTHEVAPVFGPYLFAPVRAVLPSPTG